MSGAYYNEHDRFVAAWLRELIREGLIAPGDVDERDIQLVQPGDLTGYAQCHFFAGIGGWSLALRLAGWPDARPVWTGSCPCQRFSSATRGRPTEPDLWPAFYDLISAVRPRALFGEQVPSRGWFDCVCHDLEALDYEVGAAVLPAISLGADHVRARLYFAGHSNRHSEPERAVHAQASRLSWTRCEPLGMVPTDGVSGRVAQLRALGNAIVPQVAAEFIAAWLEVRSA